MKNLWRKILASALCSFLLFFMIFIFGPSEIFFANVTEFQFIYTEFIGRTVLIALLCTLGLTLVLTLLPGVVHAVALSLVFGLSLSSYLQVMFFNKNLDLLGLNPKGYVPETSGAVVNLVIWIAVLIVLVILTVWKKEIMQKTAVYGSAFLFLIQVTALVTLLFSADEKAFDYHKEDEKWVLSGEEQFQVSSEQNIIVVILDYFHTNALDAMLEDYPIATNFLNDFTYYGNMDSRYLGTYPSLAHMLTGVEVDPELTVDEWTRTVWESERTKGFYEGLHEKNYKTNLYTPDTNILCGLNDPEILKDSFSNMVCTSLDFDIDRELLLATICKMSAYRMSPDFIKPSFYAGLDEYADIVTRKDFPIVHNNYDFMEVLKDEGLRLDDTAPYFIVQHLMGPHITTTDRYGNYKEDSDLIETAKGCMTIMEEYLDQLKALGVYDQSTIIITADHGDAGSPQVIFYLKEAAETHEETIKNKAQVSLCELQATIARAAGISKELFGKAVQDIDPADEIERKYLMRMHDNNYPEVPCYTGDKEGSENVYYEYKYTGDGKTLYNMILKEPQRIIPMKDAYF